VRETPADVLRRQLGRGATDVAQLLPDHLRGSGFGLLGGVQSLGDFASSVAVGILWTAISPTAGFAYAARWMLGTTAMPGPRSTRTSAG